MNATLEGFSLSKLLGKTQSAIQTYAPTISAIAGQLGAPQIGQALQFTSGVVSSVLPQQQQTQQQGLQQAQQILQQWTGGPAVTTEGRRGLPVWVIPTGIAAAGALVLVLLLRRR